MGHYDAQYEADDRERAKEISQRATKKANEKKLKVLPYTTFKALGICKTCAHVVFAIPNWGCTQQGICPHKPYVT